MTKILLLGVGNMGISLYRGWINSGISKDQILLVEKDNARKTYLIDKLGIESSPSIPFNWKGDAIVLAIKPTSFLQASKDLNNEKAKSALIISIVAGLTNKKLRNCIESKALIVRSMPNISSTVGKGVTVLNTNDKLDYDTKKLVEDLMSAVGYVNWIKDESLMDLITAISGSGPAYFFLFLESLIKIGVENGLPHSLSNYLVKKTAEGALKLCEDEENMRLLIESVTSPGGTTEAALDILEGKKNNLISILSKAVLAAKKRSEELAL